MNEEALCRLLTWVSPAYPTGGFSYSHGLEWAVEAGSVGGLDQLFEYVEAALARGGGWIDAVLFAHVWRAAAGDGAELDEYVELATAFRSSAETALESRQQGAAFLELTRRAWSHPLLDAFATRWRNRPIAHCAAMALACAAHEVPLVPALRGFLHSFAAGLVSAGARLIPLGQTDAQIAIARLAPVIGASARRALRTDLCDLGTAVPSMEIGSFLHETQYTRLFRS